MSTESTITKDTGLEINLVERMYDIFLTADDLLSDITGEFKHLQATRLNLMATNASKEEITKLDVELGHYEIAHRQVHNVVYDFKMYYKIGQQL